MNKKESPGRRPSIDDRLVLPPAPGGRRAISPLQPKDPPADHPASDSTIRMRRVEPAETWAAWPGKPLATAAAPLLHLLARVGNISDQPDPGNLHRYAVHALGDFDQAARNAGVSAEQTRQAHYALCASIDDVVLNTPWGAGSEWAKAPLTTTFHQAGDDRFFELLARSLERPAQDLAVIEIMFLCLSLGYMGRLRHSPRGRDDLTRSRATCHAAIAAQQKLAAPELSPSELSTHWRGVSAPHRPSRGRLPVWVVYAAGLAVCGAMFLFVSKSLNAASDAQYARTLMAPPARMPAIVRAAVVRPPVAPLETNVLDRLRSSLQADIDAGAVGIAGTPATVVLRVNTSAGFAAGSAAPSPALTALLERIGTALKREPGNVRTIAYTDNQPIRNVRFPSNLSLSGARAQAANTAIARALGDPARLSAEGRGEADPITSNATPEGREQNRRIEVVLHRLE